MHLFRNARIFPALLVAGLFLAPALSSSALSAQTLVGRSSVPDSLIATGPTFSSSSASIAALDSDSQDAQPQPQSGQITVQQRIRARREARRVAAMREVYSHRFDVEIGSGYLRFSPGASQRANEYAWNIELTRYYSSRLGVTLNVRGLYGTGYVGSTSNDTAGVYNPAISQYLFMGGPVYRFYTQPKYSISGRVLVGAAKGNFSGDLGSYPPSYFGYHDDGYAFAVAPAAVFEYNVSPALGIRLAPEYLLTTFSGKVYSAATSGVTGNPSLPATSASTVNGPSLENSLGFTVGIVYRWGK